MASVNKVILIGNLTRDPELRYTPKQTAVTEIGLACNRRYKVDDEVREEVTYVDVTFWGVQAETVAKYLEKGRSVYIEGRLKLDQWVDKDTGKNRSKLGVIGETCQFLGSRGSGEGPTGGSLEGDGPSTFQRSSAMQSPTGPPASTGSGPLADDDEEDDIPF